MFAGLGFSSMFSKRMNSVAESYVVHDFVGFLKRALLVQRVMPAKYLSPAAIRCGFCQQMMFGGMDSSGLSRGERAIGIVCGGDQVLPLSSLKIPSSRPVV